jgi:TetR/AcrR family transcriptional regulator, cholesterol catabolism regulator
VVNFVPKSTNAARHRSGDEPAPVRPGRRERNKLAVGARIRAAALALFREKGYEQATVEEIAERADVSKATVFNYFPRKEALVDALADNVWHRAEAQLRRPAGRRGSSREQVRRLLFTLIRFAEADRTLFRVLLHQSVREFWIDGRQDPVSQAFIGRLCAILDAGRTRGEIVGDVSSESAARLVERAFIGIMIDWVGGESSAATARRELDAQLRLVFEGLEARPRQP